MGGIAPEREIPAFVEQTFASCFADRGPAPKGLRGTVVLRPDTFTNHLAPEVGRAAVEGLATLAPVLTAGTPPIVGLEPSCIAALRHDAPGRLPERPHGGRGRGGDTELRRVS